METRWVKHGSKLTEESLVKWRGFPAEDATWEITYKMQEKFKDLEDKDPVKERGIDNKPRSHSCREGKQLSSIQGNLLQDEATSALRLKLRGHVLLLNMDQLQQLLALE